MHVCSAGSDMGLYSVIATKASGRSNLIVLHRGEAMITSSSCGDPRVV
jgi:hypothetical protein